VADRPTPSAERLLGDPIGSVGALELLLVLRAGDGRAHDLDELCAALGSPRSWTEVQLDALTQGRLVAQAADGGWTYAPATPRLAAAVDELARAWQRNRRAVTRWLFKPPHRRPR
jgi:DNA-binding IclR family transcriptional regulator